MSIQGFLIWAIGASVSLFANVVYYDMRRKGVKGFGRFAAFWAGNPLTWLTLLLVKEGDPVQFRPPPDDDERLLREVRMDRELRGLPPVSDATMGRGDRIDLG